MKNNASLIYKTVLIIGDFLALTAAFAVAYIIRVKFDDRPLIEQIPAETYIATILTILPLWIIINGAIGLYSRPVFENRFSELGKLLLSSILGILAVVGYDFVVDSTLFPARLVVVYAFALSLGFLIAFRTLARKTRSILFSYGRGVTNLLVVGGGKSAKSVMSQFASLDTGYRIVGVVGSEISGHPDIPVFEDLKSAERNIRKYKPHSIIQTSLYKDEDRNSEVLSFAQTRHLEFRFIPANSELYSGNIEVELFREIPVVTVHQTALTGWGRVLKRSFDLVFGLILLIITLPVMIIVAIMMKLSAPREKVFFRQVRLTQFDKPFNVYKFRSNKPKYNGLSPEEAFAKMGRPELTKEYRGNGDFLDDDPRISKIGGFLRRTSLDELPQLFNVVKGDISLVGPRALVPEELEKYTQKHHILSVKSGMTGLAQVSGRLNISFEERRRLDMYYVQNWSFWLDIVILLRTFRTVITAKGAK